MFYTSKITKKPPSFLTPPWAGLFISMVVFFRKGFAILNVLKQDHKNNNQVTGPVLYHQGVYSGDIFLAVVDYSFLVLIEYCSVKRMAWKISCICSPFLAHFWILSLSSGMLDWRKGRTKGRTGKLVTLGGFFWQEVTFIMLMRTLMVNMMMSYRTQEKLVLRLW